MCLNVHTKNKLCLTIWKDSAVNFLYIKWSNNFSTVDYGKNEEETNEEEERENKTEECGTDSQGKEFNKNKVSQG